jgi:EAL domain-containing protein (putative c-di-GMP-specific phosphodiesterase class I)
MKVRQHCHHVDLGGVTAMGALGASGLAATALVLEITERTLIVSSPLIRQQLDVKIDQSFVAALDEDEQAVALVHSIISIAEAFGLDTVAEGVETSTQLETLRRLGCQVAQGHRYSAALPVDALFIYLEASDILPSYE